MEIGGFELSQQLPGGRFGARWRATGPNGESVLLKQFARLEAAAAPAFLEAAARIRAVPNPNLARSDEPVSDASGGLWLVEEWVEGVSLGALAQEHVLSIGQALGVARGMLGGLAALHGVGLVHGLVSPATVMLDLAGQPKLVDTGAWIADREVAATDEYAAPEVAAAASPSTAADVFSLGKLIGGMLSAGPVDGALAAVLATATSVDPVARQQDAPTLLAQLSRAAERAYGPLWWTLEGVGGAVASALGAGTAGAAATAGVAAPGSAGVVSGSLGMGNAAVVGGTEVGPGGTGIVTGVVKTGLGLKKLIPLIAGGVVVVVVAGIALANTGGQKDRPETLNAPAAVSPAPSPTPTPTPTPTPPVAAGFTGTYEYVTVVKKSNNKEFDAVGNKLVGTWEVVTTCTGENCITTATRDGADVALKQTATGWQSVTNFTEKCVRSDTGKPDGTSVAMRTTRNLKVVVVTDGKVIKLAGTSNLKQLRKCKNQVVPLVEVVYAITMTLKK
jgi:hypothetical protein